MDKRTIRILTPDYKDADIACGTINTKVMCGDQEISGVTKLTLIAEPNSVWKAIIECHVVPPKEILAEEEILFV